MNKLQIDKACGGCFQFLRGDIPILYRGAMNEYLVLSDAPDEMHAAPGDKFREDSHYLQSNHRKAEIISLGGGYDVTATAVNANKQPGALVSHTVVSMDNGRCRVEVTRKWTDDVASVGDDSICFMISPGIAEYWSIRDPVPGTTKARIRLDHPWVEWGDGAILPEVVKIVAKVQSGSSALVVGRETGLLLTIESITGMPFLRCVYPRGRGYHEAEITWPSGPRKNGRIDSAVLTLQTL